MALNPFIWEYAIEDGVPRSSFAHETALQLKAGTHIALFGPRGTGKTSFTLELRRELARDHEPDAPPWQMLRVDLRRAISLPAFIGAVRTALDRHPDGQLRRRAGDAWRRLEKTIGINLGVVAAGVHTTGRVVLNEAEVLHDQLLALTQATDRLVVVFDEFQRLNSCPGEPLSIIRSALMEPDSGGRVSLLLTGSLREKLELMLHTDTEPIWDQTHDVALPPIEAEPFAAYLEHAFAASGKPIDERAAELLLELTESHPKRTQHLAWQTWEAGEDGESIDRDAVQAAFDQLLSTRSHSTDFGAIVDGLLAGEDSDVNGAKVLFLVAGGASPASRAAPPRYGLSGPDTAKRALERLRTRGVVEGSGSHWRIVDPLFAEWLRRNDPLGMDPSSLLDW
ncbi:MAG: AAA family ATPase [Solirubrobacteraceae bacterium]